MLSLLVPFNRCAVLIQHISHTKIRCLRLRSSYLISLLLQAHQTPWCKSLRKTYTRGKKVFFNKVKSNYPSVAVNSCFLLTNCTILEQEPSSLLMHSAFAEHHDFDCCSYFGCSCRMQGISRGSTVLLQHSHPPPPKKSSLPPGIGGKFIPRLYGTPICHLFAHLAVERDNVKKKFLIIRKAKQV